MTNDKKLAEWEALAKAAAVPCSAPFAQYDDNGWGRRQMDFAKVCYTAVPELCAEVRRLREALAMAMEAYEEMLAIKEPEVKP